MLGLGLIKDAVGGIVSPIASIFQKKQERKKAVETAQARIAKARVDGENQITMSDAEWEALSVEGQQSSWKDEYVTVIITAPLVGLIAGGVWLAFTGDDRLLTGVNDGLRHLADAGVDMGNLMYAVVLAAVGLKMWRAK